MSQLCLLNHSRGIGHADLRTVELASWSSVLGPASTDAIISRDASSVTWAS